ncbi:MAG TPA: hypothetical protein VN669_06135 [Candidatus Acidoferrales bacterium]|nr:hypothetical protein [Candidatus Acidoferrales bacterium]
MGVRASETGVTLKFFNVDGTPDQTRQDVKGEFAYFFSTKRPEAPGNTDPIHGSPEWLTDVIVVDHPSKLAQLPPTQTSILLTSGASKLVTVQWDVGGGKKSEPGGLRYCMTICVGHDGYYGSEQRYYAETVLVLPYDTPIQAPDADHKKLWDAWVKAWPKLESLSAKPTPELSREEK